MQREAAQWLAEWLPAQIESPALELGAGTGLFTRHLDGRTAKLVVCDHSPQMIAAGRAVLPAVEWVQADAAQPPARHDGYRWLFSCSLMQWIPDPMRAFRAWKDGSADGARLISGWFIRGTLDDFFAVCPEASPFVWRDAAEWTDLLAQGGWIVHRQETKKFNRCYPDSVTMLRSIHNVGAVVPRRVGAGKLRGALRRYDQAHQSSEGVRATFEFLRVEAVRS